MIGALSAMIAYDTGRALRGPWWPACALAVAGLLVAGRASAVDVDHFLTYAQTPEGLTDDQLEWAARAYLPPDALRGDTLRIGGLPSASVFTIDARRSLVAEIPITLDPSGNIHVTDNVGAVRVVDFTSLMPPGTDADLVADLLIIQASAELDRFRGDRLLASAERLHRLGRDRCLRALHAYLDLGRMPPNATLDDERKVLRRQWEVGYDEKRVTLLCRLLFEPRDGAAWRPPALGMPSPNVEGAWPRLFPLAVVEGIPFLVTNGYILDGVPEPASTSLAFAEEQCRLVAALPVPTGDPLDAAGAVVTADEVRAAFSHESLAQVQAIVRRQAYLVRRETYGWDRLGPVGLDAVCCDDALYERKWAELLEVAHRWPVRWDAEVGAFVANPAPR